LSRTSVEEYLKSHNIDYGPVYGGGSSGWSYATKIGEEPGDHLICSSWTVEIEFDFAGSTKDSIHFPPAAADMLKEIREVRFGDCL
jgi:hypothetical protein